MQNQPSLLDLIAHAVGWYDAPEEAPAPPTIPSAAPTLRTEEAEALAHCGGFQDEGITWP